MTVREPNRWRRDEQSYEVLYYGDMKLKDYGHTLEAKYHSIILSSTHLRIDGDTVLMYTVDHCNLNYFTIPKMRLLLAYRLILSKMGVFASFDDPDVLATINNPVPFPVFSVSLYPLKKYGIIARPDHSGERLVCELWIDNPTVIRNAPHISGVHYASIFKYTRLINQQSVDVYKVRISVLDLPNHDVEFDSLDLAVEYVKSEWKQHMLAYFEMTEDEQLGLDALFIDTDQQVTL